MLTFFSLTIFGFLQVGISNRAEASFELSAKGTAVLVSSSCSRLYRPEKFDLCFQCRIRSLISLCSWSLPISFRRHRVSLHQIDMEMLAEKGAGRPVCRSLHSLVF